MAESTHILVYIGLLFLASQMAGRIAHLIGIPRVVGYLISGIVIGPSLLGLLDKQLVEHQLSLITDIALAVIAFSIGGSLHIKEVKELGTSILVITLLEAIGGVVAVFAALMAFHKVAWLGIPQTAPELYTASALIVAAVSAATAPAAVMGVIHEYRARGPLTTILLGVVALDDGLIVILYAFALTTAGLWIGFSDESALIAAVTGPIKEIGIALLLGGLAGFLLRFATGWFPQRTNLLAFVIGVILLTSGCAISLHSSSLLANMALGFVVTNFVKHSEDLFHRIEEVEEPIFGLFFALAGAHVDSSLLLTAGGIAIIITVARFGGKLVGTQIGARIVHAPKLVRRYLGISLLPEAGVTIGLMLHARGQLTSYTTATDSASQSLALIDYFVNAVLASVVINELMTPFLLRLALIRAGETRNNHPHP